MKLIFELILAAIIIFFVWNILKRIFFTAFYKYTGFKPNNQQQDIKNSNKKVEKKVNWDAETVDYEEIKENQKR
ncbi:hypothetical protein N0B16_10835 [Chryseobacterium sp. GMJ5]|uniref:AraC family transcriptional regulator n=1 Tax=Chryseobacterium gilvum TaxID=2976534 RepID=A0ABT2VY57_9FLAO|nr:hypothetical protein [Chryseobacterium gilvum]MCU7614934.1 hypothetical protein [Chryseobacterium gilvum]